MRKIPGRFGHFVYGIIQSGLTCAVAAGIASYPFHSSGAFLPHWISAWVMSWLLMLPVVLFAAPTIRRLTRAITTD